MFVEQISGKHNKEDKDMYKGLNELIEIINEQLEEAMDYSGLTAEEILNGRTNEDIAWELYRRGLGIEDIEQVL